MHIEIENLELDNSDFPKKDGTGRWYTRKQPFLLFKEGSKYPDKGVLTLAFSDKEIDRNNAQILAKGIYDLDIEHGIYIDKRGSLNFSFKPENLKLRQATKAA